MNNKDILISWEISRVLEVTSQKAGANASQVLCHTADTSKE